MGRSLSVDRTSTHKFIIFPSHRQATRMSTWRRRYRSQPHSKYLVPFSPSRPGLPPETYVPWSQLLPCSANGPCSTPHPLHLTARIPMPSTTPLVDTTSAAASRTTSPTTVPAPVPIVASTGPIYPPYAHALAGAGGGLATVTLLHPLDTLRTRLQSVDRRAVLAQRGEALRAFREIVLREGAPALYRGAVPAAFGSVLSWACYFHWFQRARAFVQPAVTHDTGSHLLAGTIAGLMTSVATNPIWVIKVRLQLQRAGKVLSPGYKPYKGFVDGLRSILREEGMRGFYRGIGPSVWLVSHGALQFTMYERLKEQLRDDSDPGKSTSVTHSLVASTASKLVASLATYPMQVARTRMQERFVDGQRYGRFHTAFMYIFRTEGIKGLYRGLSANVVRVTPQAAVTFVTYEQILKLCAN